MKPRIMLMVIVLTAAVASQPALARGNRGGGGGGQSGGKYTLKLDPVENKTLPSNDQLPVWTKDDVTAFCEGRYKTIQQDQSQCEKAHKNDVGKKMTPADLQEMQAFKDAGATHAKRGNKKAGRVKKGNGKAAGRKVRGANRDKAS